MVTVKSALRALYRSAFIAGATVSGGPPAGAAAAKLLATPAGKAAIEAGVEFTLADEDVDTGNFAAGGLVTQPTLAMIGEAGPELVLPLSSSMKPKRKPSAYQKRYKKNFRKIAPDYKLKSGKWKKNGFKRAVRAAHKMSKK